MIPKTPRLMLSAYKARVMPSGVSRGIAVRHGRMQLSGLQHPRSAAVKAQLVVQLSATNFRSAVVYACCI